MSDLATPDATLRALPKTKTDEFVARIGPPRIVLAAVLLAYGGLGLAGKLVFDDPGHWAGLIDEYFALGLGLMRLAEEGAKAWLRHRWPIVRLDITGVFDRRTMVQPVPWADIEWVEPQPAGVPDRLRLQGKVRPDGSNAALAALTGFGRWRNLALRLLRRIPAGEVVVTFGGLDKAAQQAAAWIADHKPGLTPSVWATQPAPLRAVTAPSPAVTGPLISAGVYRPSMIADVASGAVAAVGLFLLAFWSTGLPDANVAAWIKDAAPVLEPFADMLAKLAISALAVLLAGCAILGTLWQTANWLAWRAEGDRMIVVDHSGMRVAKISDDHIAWADIEHLSYELVGVSRLISPIRFVSVQLRDGVRIASPRQLWFAALDWPRRLIQPETFPVNHVHSGTSPSEIIETIQRHELPVALREVARG